MGDSYDRVQAKERVEAVMQMARIIVDMEELWPDGHPMCPPQHFPLYMHIAEATEQDDTDDLSNLGISGRISRDLEGLNHKLRERINDLEAKMAVQNSRLHSRLDEMVETAAEPSAKRKKKGSNRWNWK